LFFSRTSFCGTTNQTTTVLVTIIMATLIPPSSIDDIHLVHHDNVVIPVINQREKIPLFRRLGLSTRRFIDRINRDSQKLEGRVSTNFEGYDHLKLRVTAETTPAQTTVVTSRKGGDLNLAVAAKLQTAKGGPKFAAKTDTNGNTAFRAKIRTNYGVNAIARFFNTNAGTVNDLELNYSNLLSTVPYNLALVTRQRNGGTPQFAISTLVRPFASLRGQTYIGAESQILPGYPYLGNTVFALYNRTADLDLTIKAHTTHNGTLGSIDVPQYSVQVQYNDPKSKTSYAADVTSLNGGSTRIVGEFAAQTAVYDNTVLTGKYNTGTERGSVGVRYLASKNLALEGSMALSSNLRTAPSFGFSVTLQN